MPVVLLLLSRLKVGPGLMRFHGGRNQVMETIGKGVKERPQLFIEAMLSFLAQWHLSWYQLGEHIFANVHRFHQAILIDRVRRIISRWMVGVSIYHSLDFNNLEFLCHWLPLSVSTLSRKLHWLTEIYPNIFSARFLSEYSCCN